MTPAPVGFQCPECVYAGRAAVREARTPVGGRQTVSATVTVSLIGLNAVIFAVGLLLGGGSGLAAEFGMQPVAIALGGEWYRLITAAFLHGGLLHIAFNMYVLWVLGPSLERVLGHARFIILYLMAALGGSVTSYVFSPINTVSVGASGAIFGVMAAILVVGRRYRQDMNQVAILLAVNFAIGFLVPNVDWRAHLGGALTGAAVAAVMAYAPKQSRVLWQTLGVLFILLFLVVATIVRSATIQQLAELVPN